MLQPITESLKFDWHFFLWQVALFIALVLVLDRVFWKPMLAHLAKRDAAIQDAYTTVDTTRHEMEALRADYQARIVKIEAEARAHIQQAIKEAQSERERILTEAREQTEATIRQGIGAMEQEKVQALAGLHDRMVGIALSAVDKAVGKVVDPSALRTTVEERVSARN